MILAFVEHDRGRLSELSLEALTFGRRLAERVGVQLGALTMGDDAPELAEGLAAHGATAVHVAVGDELGDYAPKAWARAVVDLVGRLEPSAVIAAASDRGAEVLAHAAALLDLPLASNCTAVEAAEPGESWIVSRQRWGGSLLEEARISGAVKLLTVAPHAVLPETGSSTGAAVVSTFTPELADEDLAVKVTGRVEVAGGTVSLSEAKVVVGGGRGVGGTEGFGPLEELAGLLGGAVGCSRVVTSNGWRPHADQIGQTGTRIAPDLYVACGISGATQHIVGCRAAKKILVINTDPEAPIMSQADYAIIGDLRQVVPAINEEIRKARGG